MRMSRQGVVGLPVRLTISLMIIALMVPPISAMADNIHDDIGERELSDVAEELRECISYVYSKGPSIVTHRELSIPDGCHLAIGGEQNTVIRLFVDDEPAGRVIMDVPVAGDDTILYGDVLLELSNVSDGGQKVAVKEI